VVAARVDFTRYRVDAAAFQIYHRRGLDLRVDTRSAFFDMSIWPFFAVEVRCALLAILIFSGLFRK